MRVSAIVPTIGRPESLFQLLESLLEQEKMPDEVIIADGSEGDRIEQLVADPRWSVNGLLLRYIKVLPPNAVRQRNAAIKIATGNVFLFLDDDVVLEEQCVITMCKLLTARPQIVAVVADYNNQSWSQPTRVWRLYLRIFHGLNKVTWQGAVVGPLLRFGYHPSPTKPAVMGWLGMGNSLVRRSAFDQVGGFSEFFLHRCTMNEDVDLGLKLRRVGEILLCPKARLGHFHAITGRLAPKIVAEDDLYNRFMILWQTLSYSRLRAFGLVAVYYLVESGSNFLGALLRWRLDEFMPRFIGYSRAMWRILF